MKKETKDQYDQSKLRELVLYVARRSQGDSRFGAVKLNKLLFFADFLAYRELGHSITGAEYQKLERGPAPRPLLPLLQRMEMGDDIETKTVDVYGYRQKRVVPLRDANIDRFSGEEIKLVDAVIKACRGKNAKGMSSISHRFTGWMVAALGETIPYTVALVGRRKPTATERAHGRRLEAEAKACLAS